MPELVIRRGLAEPDTSASYVPHKPQRPEKSDGGKAFRIQSEYQPAGDQPARCGDRYAHAGEVPRPGAHTDARQITKAHESIRRRRNNGQVIERRQQSPNL